MSNTGITALGFYLTVSPRVGCFLEESFGEHFVSTMLQSKCCLEASLKNSKTDSLNLKLLKDFHMSVRNSQNWFCWFVYCSFTVFNHEVPKLQLILGKYAKHELITTISLANYWYSNNTKLSKCGKTENFSLHDNFSKRKNNIKCEFTW